MTIDWLTILAQAVNFLILVWLMKRFLYKPVLKAIAAREKLISDELASADKKKDEAQKESDEFKEKNQQFDQSRAALLGKAVEDAQTERQRLLDEARKAAVALSSKSKDDLQTEERGLRQSISRRIQTETFSIAKKALIDLAGTDVQERMVDLFCQRIQELSPQERVMLADQNKEAQHKITVQSASELSTDQKKRAESAIRQTLGADSLLSFDVLPELIAGIEITANGHKAGWCIAEYLVSLELSGGEIAKEKSDHGNRNP